MTRIAAFPSVFFGWKVVATAFAVATCTFGVGYYGPSKPGTRKRSPPIANNPPPLRRLSN
jgi:hypothetical protein